MNQGKQDTVLFYLIEHGPSGYDITTDVLQALVRRADTVFLERVACGSNGGLERVETTERDYNRALAKGSLGGASSECLSHTEVLRVMMLGDGGELGPTSKRVKFERYSTGKYGNDIDHLRDSDPTQFYLGAEKIGHYPGAQKRIEEFVNFHLPREESASGQIAAVGGSVLVVFGEDHLNLARQVGRFRPVEVYYPHQ